MVVYARDVHTVQVSELLLIVPPLQRDNDVVHGDNLNSALSQTLTYRQAVSVLTHSCCSSFSHKRDFSLLWNRL